MTQTKFNIRKYLTENGFIVSEEDKNTYLNGNGISIRFYETESGLEMINVVDTQKPRSKWMHLRFRCDFIASVEDFLFLLQGSTVRGV